MANGSVTIVDRKIVQIREMTYREAKSEGWEGYNNSAHGLPTVIVLDNGTKLYPSRDSEGNGPGTLFGTTRDGKHFGLA